MPSRHATAAKKKAEMASTDKNGKPFLAFAEQVRKQHPGMIVLFRFGDQYDALGEDVDKLAKIIGLTVLSKSATPYVTFRAEDLEKNLGLLIRAGERVAVCEADEAIPTRIAEPAGDVEPKLPPAEISAPIGPDIRMVLLADITADAALNPRHELNADAIEDYAEVYRVDPARMPRPILFEDDVRYWLASGFHRVAGAADAGLKMIECEIRQGTRLDALIFAAGENKTNGVKRTPADKRRAVENLLRACPEWSNRRISEHVEVHHDLVGDVRRIIFPDAAKGKRLGKDGKARGPKSEKTKTWRGMRFAEAWDTPEDMAEEIVSALKTAGLKTLGELADALKDGKTFGLKLVDVDTLMEAIEIVSADDEEPVEFARRGEDEAEAEPEPQAEDDSEDPPALFAQGEAEAKDEDPEVSAEQPPAAAPASQPVATGPVFNLAGNWKWTEASSKAELDAELIVTDGVITGTIGQGTVDRGPPDGHFRAGTVTGNAIDFDCTRQDKVTGLYITHRYQGKLIDADHITGTIVHDTDGAMGEPTKERWDARRLLERVARDQLGRELPRQLKPIFAKEAAGKLIEASRLLANGAQAVKFTDTDPFVGGYLKTRPHLAQEPKVLAAFIRRNLVPYCVCPICDGDGDSGQCPTCAGKGWLSRRGFDEAAEPARERARKLGLGEVSNPDADEDAADISATRFIPAGPGLDPTGHEIPPALRDLFAADWLQDEVRRLERLAQMLRGSTSWLTWLKPEVHQTCDTLIRGIRDAIPFAVCRECGGSAKGCGACRTSGYIPKYEHENLEAQKRQHRSETRPDTKKNKSK